MQKVIKAFSILLCFCLLITPFRVNAVSQGEINATASLVVSTASAKAGETVEVTVDVINNPGITSVRLMVEYDATRLKLSNIDYNGEWRGSPTKPQPGKMQSPFRLVWSLGTEDYTVATSTFATLTFDILDSAEEGDAFINISYEEGDICNIYYEDIPFSCVNGKVTVLKSDDPSPDPQNVPTFKVGMINSEIGAKDVQIPVEVINNPGITSVRLMVEYDDTRLKLSGINYNGEWRGSPTKPQPGKMQSPFRLVWSLGTEDYTVATSTFATLTFDILDSAEEGDAFINISYEEGDICNINYEDIPFTCINGKITVNTLCTHVNKTDIPEVPATCKVVGTKAHSECKDCGKLFLNGKEVFKSDLTIAINPANHIGETEIRNFKPATDKAEGYTGDTYCSDCGERIKEGKTIPITLVRPIFDDKIALEYAVDLPGVTEAPNVTISVDGVKVSKTTATQTKDGKWSFTCLDIVPSKLDAQITVEIEGADVEIPSYSVKEYCAERLDNSGDETYKQLISDVLRYGAVAQEFETGVASDMADVANILPIKSDVIPYENKFEKIGEDEEEKVWKGATLILENTITMRLYYNGNVAPDINSISCKSHHSVSINTEKKCIEITGFTPLDYDEEITATFKGATVKYSVGSYISRMSISGNELTKRIVAAIQNYGRAAEAYALSSNQSN